MAVIKHVLMPELRASGTLTPELEKVVYTLEWVHIEEEEFIDSTWREWGC